MLVLGLCHVILERTRLSLYGEGGCWGVHAIISNLGSRSYEIIIDSRVHDRTVVGAYVHPRASLAIAILAASGWIFANTYILFHLRARLGSSNSALGRRGCLLRR